MGTMFAIYERDIGGSGEGHVVDVSLYEPLFRVLLGDIEAYDVSGRVPERTGNRSPNSAPRNLYETKDGYLALSASSQQIFENVCEAIDRPELVTDERFETNDARVANVEDLDEIIESWTRKRHTNEAITAMQEADAIVGPVYEMPDIAADEQYRGRDSIIEVGDPELGEVTTPNAFPVLSRTPGGVESLGPRHGEHNEQVYRDELGIPEETYAELREDSII
jgi:crotonobetainyl-CoA:carnitine CoA-transferase CaiB-like acyl-CoA transferase